MADNAQVIGGFNPALSGAEQYGDALKPATTTNTKALAAGLRSMVKAMGGPIADRMAQHGAQQRQRLASGDYSPTPLTDESIDLADSVAGGLVGNLGMAAALRAYHGSPHRFDRFDMSKIGTGEGTRNFVIFDDKLIDITHVDGTPVTKAERAEALAQHQDALPMDQASRMARARGMGFDVETPLFHGAADDFDAFDLQIDRTGAGYDAAWLTDDASLAYRYSRSAGAGPQDSVVMEVVAGLKNPKTIDVEDIIRKEAENMDFDLDQLGSMQEAQELFLPPNWKKDMAAAAKDEGHDGLVLKNFIDMPHGDYAPSSSTVVAVFDPAKIRKMSARFDPAKRDSADLLAGVAGAAGLGLAASLRAWAAQREDKGV